MPSHNVARRACNVACVHACLGNCGRVVLKQGAVLLKAAHCCDSAYSGSASGTQQR